MAIHTGFLIPLVDFSTVFDTRLFYFKDGWGVNYGRFYGRSIPQIIGANTWSEGLEPAGGTLTSNLPIDMNAANLTGFKAPTLVDVFYNRILVEPTGLDFGIVAGTQEKTILVWNGFLEMVVNLEGLVETDFLGISVSGDTPPPDVVFTQLQERTYTIQATQEGPPSIDAVLTFEWETPYPDNIVTIVGRRIIAFPYFYKTGMTETLEWQTKVLTTRDGTETRSRIRTAPRQSFAASAYISLNENSRVDNLFYGWRSQIWASPVWGEVRTVTSAVTAGDFTINVDTEYGDFREDSLAMIYENDRTFDLFEITSLTTSSLTLNRGVSEDFSAVAVVVPVRESRMRAEPQRIGTGYNASVNVTFEVDDNIEIPSSASAVQYLSEDTYLDLPLKPGGEVFRDTYKKDIDTIDYKTGVVTQLSYWNYTKTSREFLVVLEGLQEIWEFRTWLNRRAGKQRPFYMPTFEDNLRALGSGNIGATFNAVNDENAILASDRNHIYVEMIDGTYYLRQITDIFNASGNEVTVTIDSAITEDLTDIAFISYMGLKRLSSDRIQFKWLANNVVECKIPIIEVTP